MAIRDKKPQMATKNGAKGPKGLRQIIWSKVMLSKWKALFNFFDYEIREADLEFAKKNHEQDSQIFRFYLRKNELQHFWQIPRLMWGSIDWIILHVTAGPTNGQNFICCKCSLYPPSDSVNVLNFKNLPGIYLAAIIYGSWNSCRSFQTNS